jgi:GT2 family glycosyltransferase
MPGGIELSIIIVNFNTKDLTLACLRSLKLAKKTSDRWEIIIVDNGSHDDLQGSLESLGTHEVFYRNIQFIANGRNLGFSKANNIGIRRSTGAYLLLLNSDTEVRGSAIQTMQKFMTDHPRAGLSTCKLELTDGNIDPASHRGFPTPWASLTYFLRLERVFPRSHVFSQYHMGYKNMRIAHEIDCPSGAFFLTRRSVIDTVGYLDEDFFMYGEDVDWAYRVKQAGWEIWFNPEAAVLHKKKQSGRAHGNAGLRKQTQKYFYETMLLFYEKHYKKKYPMILYYVIRIAIQTAAFFIT